jgi:ABC-type glycerol-3-phosphate transport system substrate-binding protein
MPRVYLLALILLVLAAVLFIILSSDEPSDYLVFSTWGTPLEVQGFQRLIDRYNATMNPRHPVKLSYADHVSYMERLMVQAAERSLPDIIFIDQKDLPLFIHRGLCEDLTPFMSRDTSFHISRFIPALLPAAMSQ